MFDVSLTSAAFIDPPPSTIWLEIALIKRVCPLIPPLHRFTLQSRRRYQEEETVLEASYHRNLKLRFFHIRAYSPRELVNRTFRRYVIKNEMQFRWYMERDKRRWPNAAQANWAWDWTLILNLSSKLSFRNGFYYVDRQRRIESCYVHRVFLAIRASIFGFVTSLGSCYFSPALNGFFKNDVVDHSPAN